MTTNVLKFVGLTDRDRKKVRALPKVSKRDKVEMRIVHSRGGQDAGQVPPEAAALIATVLKHLGDGEKVAVLTEDQELSPNDAATILGMSRPLVVHRMDVGDLPFRYVGKHRRSKLRDVLALKSKVDGQRAALKALAEETAELQ